MDEVDRRQGRRVENTEMTSMKDDLNLQFEVRCDSLELCLSLIGPRRTVHCDVESRSDLMTVRRGKMDLGCVAHGPKVGFITLNDGIPFRRWLHVLVGSVQWH
jgi:hypothetical protein